ncbi:Aryl-alcohol dehydrogenase [Pseudocercospora fuligena]|uniref:Aryl-alcohol dehydrogenase n=1 Tax=Pseudocercospora fuligena TaxID=685502 RepID=A0A8H6VFK7_9PEZI|nr:Aryl-alcohol dehydrogenase [Pseudocercospora fuligena]
MELTTMAPTTTRAIVSRAPTDDGKRQWNIEEVQVEAPQGNEVLVELVASGICHTDLGCGSFPDGVGPFPVPPYPRVLGHEGAGYVKEVGPLVSTVRPGDAVLMSFTYCQQCHNCLHGSPGYCPTFTPLNFTGYLHAFSNPNEPSEKIGGCFFGQSSSARLTRAQEQSLVRVTDLVKNIDELKMFAPLGCGIQTGAGTVTELASAKPSDAVAIIGLGGVGLSAIMGAKVANCKTIIGIDRFAERLELARTLGATDTINTSKLGDLSLTEKVRELTGGVGTTITIDATGVPALIEQGIQFTAQQGKFIILGVAPAEAVLTIPIVGHMMSGKQIMGSVEGGVTPSKYIPRLIEWHRKGQLPLEKLVKFYKAEKFEDAIHGMHDGTTIKPVIVW